MPRNTQQIRARGQPSVDTRPLTQSHVFTAVAATDLKQATDHSLARSTVNSWDLIICSMPRINTQAMSNSQVRATIHHHWLKNTHPTLTGQQAMLLDSWNQDDAPKVHVSAKKAGIAHQKTDSRRERKTEPQQKKLLPADMSLHKTPNSRNLHCSPYLPQVKWEEMTMITLTQPKTIWSVWSRSQGLPSWVRRHSWQHSCWNGISLDLTEDTQPNVSKELHNDAPPYQAQL